MPGRRIFSSIEQGAQDRALPIQLFRTQAGPDETAYPPRGELPTVYFVEHLGKPTFDLVPGAQEISFHVPSFDEGSRPGSTYVYFDGHYLPENTDVIAANWLGRWFVIEVLGQRFERPIRVVLNDDMEAGDITACTLMSWNGTSWVGTSVVLDVQEGLGLGDGTVIAAGTAGWAEWNSEGTGIFILTSTAC